MRIRAGLAQHAGEHAVQKSHMTTTHSIYEMLEQLLSMGVSPALPGAPKPHCVCGKNGVSVGSQSVQNSRKAAI